MNLARQIAKYEGKGFSREKAEINALMENAIFAIFRDFPDAFLLFGGATLISYFMKALDIPRILICLQEEPRYRREMKSLVP